MKKLILVSGPAAIGKSTWSKAYMVSHPDEKVEIIAADEVRKDMYGSYRCFPPNGNMMIIYEKMIEIASDYAKNNESVTVIFDTTMLYDERRLFFRRHLSMFDDYSLVCLKLHDYSLCLKRNKMRPEEKWVPENIIADMAKHYADPSDETKAHFDHFYEIYVD